LSPHAIFWPFDLGRPTKEKERTRAPVHIADALRVGVLAGDEGCELRLAGHLMACEQCQEPAISLWELLRDGDAPALLGRQYSCLQARNALFRYMEGGCVLETAAAVHLRECVGCVENFLEPAKSLYALIVDESAISAQD